MTTPLDAGEALRQVDVRTLLRRLALRRPVFHAEADFQQELAWQVHDAHPDWPVRLEVRARIPSRDGHRERVDALIYTPAGGVAVELKYLTDKLDIEIGDELFALPRQGAQDITGYDVVKDIVRVEHYVGTGMAVAGVVVALTNDPSYWTDPAHGRVTGAAAFRLYDGTVLTGERAWGERSGPGTRKGREATLVVRGQHTLRWLPYSDRPEVRRAEFRVLVIELAGVERMPPNRA